MADEPRTFPPFTVTFPRGVECFSHWEEGDKDYGFINAVIHIPGGREAGYSTGGGWVAADGTVTPYKGFEDCGDWDDLAEDLGMDPKDIPAVLDLLGHLNTLIPKHIELEETSP